MADRQPSAEGRPEQASSTATADLGKRVEQMETTRSFGMQLTIAIKDCLRQSINEGKDVKNWERIANELFASTRNQTILVGVCGETGMGKSSLINALLDVVIAPTSEAEACTAAVCVFGWNSEDDPNKRFHAKVTYKSVENIKQDLTAFIGEARELEEIGREGCDQDVKARKDVIKKKLKLIEGWSGLTENDIRTANTAQDIIRRCKRVFFTAKGVPVENAHQKDIAAGSLKEFRKLLSPYIDSKRKNTDWPLVDVVEIFLKAAVLEHGVKLVDLPGVQDALESRSAIATNYMWRLDKRIVAVPAARATDSKTAMDLLLPSTEVLDMKLDNQFKRDSLAIAVNSIDSIDIRNAAEEFGDLNGSIEGLAADVEWQTDAVREISSEIEEVEGDIRELRASGEAGDEEEETSSASQEYGHGDAEQTESAALEALKLRLESFKQKKKAAMEECAQATHRLKYRCIQARNQRIFDNFADTFNDQECGPLDAPSEEPTNIFPNSSHAYVAHKSGIPLAGFPDRESTGIDALRQWIVKVSLPRREVAAKNHIQSLNVLFDAANGWIRFTQDENDELYRLSGQVGKKTLEKLILHYQCMDVNIMSEIKRTSTGLGNLRALRDSHIGYRYKKVSTANEEIDQSLELFDKAVASWKLVPGKDPGQTRDIHWITYRKCLRECGGEWTSKRKGGATHSWIDGIYQAFWRPCLPYWQQMRQDLADLESQLIASVRLHFGNFSATAVNEEILSEKFRAVLKREMFVLNNELETFISYIEERFRWYRESVRDCRVDSREMFTSKMRAGFVAALGMSGRGSFKKQRDIVDAHVGSLRLELFKGCRDSLEDKLINDKNSMIAQLKREWVDKKKSQMRNQLHEIVRSVCPKLPKNGAGQVHLGDTVVTDPAVVKVIQESIDKWRETWAIIEPQLCAPEMDTTMVDAEMQDQGQEAAQGGQKVGGKGKRPSNTSAVARVSKKKKKNSRAGAKAEEDDLDKLLISLDTDV